MTFAHVGSKILRCLFSGLCSCFFTLMWFGNVSLFALTISGIVQYIPEQHDWKHSPWALGFALPFTTFCALTEWFPRWLGLKITYTDEQIREMRETRVHGIKSLLQRLLTVEEACEMLSDEYVRIGQYDDAQRQSDGIRNWFSNYAQEGDELWFYDTGGNSWEELRGENGFVIVRHGEVVEWRMWWIN